MPIPNITLLDQVLAHIETNQEMWDQTYWARADTSLAPDTIERMLLEDPTNPACGAAMCFAGTAVVFQGYRLEFYLDHGDDGPELRADGCKSTDGVSYDIETKARELLGLDDETAYELFRSTNSLARIHEIVTNIKNTPQRPGGHLTWTTPSPSAAT